MRKIVVITEADAGVGRASADEFARAGYDVALLPRDPDPLEAAALARSGGSGQLTKEPEPHGAPGSLFEPVKGDCGSHGRFDGRAKPRSLRMFTGRPRTAFPGPAGVPALLGLYRLAQRLDV